MRVLFAVESKDVFNNDLFYIDAITDADKTARLRQVAKQKNLERSAEERAELSNQIQQRYSLADCHN